MDLEERIIEEEWENWIYYDCPSRFCDAVGISRKRINYLGTCFVYMMVLDLNLDAKKPVPLYVGKTFDIRKRVSQHRSKAWFKYVDYIWVEELERDSQASKLEAELIQKLRPVFNRQVRNRRDKDFSYPKMTLINGMSSLLKNEKFNGDDHYDYVTKELPSVVMADLT